MILVIVSGPGLPGSVGGIDAIRYVCSSATVLSPHWFRKFEPDSCGASNEPWRSARWQPEQLRSYAVRPALACAAVNEGVCAGCARRTAIAELPTIAASTGRKPHGRAVRTEVMACSSVRRQGECKPRSLSESARRRSFENRAD